MKLWHLIVGAAILWMIFGTDSGTKSSSHNKNDTSIYPRYHNAPVIDEEDSSEKDSDKEDGEYDCTVFNTSTGNGPYTLSCEKDSGTIIINFPNGGYIVVDEDGFHPPTGNHWDVELY
jgi:hypothetical protein